MRKMPMYPGAMTTTEFFHYYCRKLGNLVARGLLVFGMMAFLSIVLFW